MIRTLFKKKHFYLITTLKDNKDCKFLDFLQQIKIIGECRIYDTEEKESPFDSQDNFWECELIKKFNK